MGYRLNRLDEPVFMSGPKPLLPEFGIHHRLESCAYKSTCLKKQRRGKGAKQALVHSSFVKHEMKGNEVNWGQIAKIYCA